MDWNRPAAAEDEATRLRRRDPATLLGLLSEYQHRLFGYLVHLVRDPVAAEDLFQQTWLRVIENAGSYDGRRFDAWLFAIAHNLAMDDLRRRRPEALDESGIHFADPGPDALERCLAEERSRSVRAAAVRLPAVYREVLALRFEQGLKLETIAEVVGAPLSTVKSRLRRGLEALRKELQA